MALAVTDRAHRLAICERLRADYQPQFDAVDGGVNPWANATHVGVEILFAQWGRRAWDSSAQDARRPWMIGRAVEYRSIVDAETEVRRKLDKYLESLGRPGMRTNRSGPLDEGKGTLGNDDKCQGCPPPSPANLSQA